MDKLEVKRLAYTHQGRTIYEWEQTLQELHVYITPPPGVTAKMIDCKIGPSSMTLGLKGNPPFLNEKFEAGVNSDESLWCMEDGEIHIVLTKGSKGVPWSAVFQGHTKVDPYTQSEVQKALMLERFQEENPGFDFSGASFNGQVPDPKTFMGGVGYK